MYMNQYLSRACDSELQEVLSTMGAVLIVPIGCLKS
jgi:hypothetical protein